MKVRHPQRQITRLCHAPVRQKLQHRATGINPRHHLRRGHINTAGIGPVIGNHIADIAFRETCVGVGVECKGLAFGVGQADIFTNFQGRIKNILQIRAVKIQIFRQGDPPFGYRIFCLNAN